MRVIIAGSRTLTDYSLLEEKMNKILVNAKDEITIISGGAKGADQLGERYAIVRGYKLVKMPAEWEKYGKRAGYVRNEKMAQECTHAVIFWDSKSPGSKHMIDLCVKMNIPHRVIRI